MTELVLHFVLLEHIGHPDDPAGKHFDLLLEQAKACETWRLAEIPVAEGPSVAASQLPDHRLAWLHKVEGEVSGGRGFARRVDGGSYKSIATSFAGEARAVLLSGTTLSGVLRMTQTEATLSQEGTT
jgi:hypothetical protein